jgi:hypothetical protein
MTMKDTTDHLDNIVDIIHACRKKNKKIGARLKHRYVNKENIMVNLTGGGTIHIPIPFAERSLQSRGPLK